MGWRLMATGLALVLLGAVLLAPAEAGAEETPPPEKSHGEIPPVPPPAVGGQVGEPPAPAPAHPVPPAAVAASDPLTKEPPAQPAAGETPAGEGPTPGEAPPQAKPAAHPGTPATGSAPVPRPADGAAPGAVETASSAPLPPAPDPEEAQAGLAPAAPEPAAPEPAVPDPAVPRPREAETGPAGGKGENGAAPPVAGDSPADGSQGAGTASVPAAEDAALTPDAADATEPGGGFAGVPDGDLFPTSPVIEAQKEFWIDIFARYSSEQGVIHDGLLTQPVFEVLDMTGTSRRAQRRLVRQRQRVFTAELRKLARAVSAGKEPTPEGQRLLKLLPPGITPKEIREKAREVRFQRGLADRFQKGLRISGGLQKRMRKILADRGVPPDLVFLPHVESSFNIRAYSKFGAAGIWQFTRGTGRLFLDIRYEVDERLDPFKATAAAGTFLRRNFERLQSWPLAITAYNHGPQGLERIVARRGTRDLGDFIENYHGRLFKFASKNFYAEFLAAREVATHYEKFFGPVELDQPYPFARVEIPFYLDFSAASEALGVDEAVLAKLNPALRMPVLVGTKYIPKGFTLNVPPKVSAEAFLAAVPKEERRARQKLTEVVRVERGDTLYGLGRRFNVPWTVIARANNITAYHRLRPGQRLVIPRRAAGARKWVATALPEPAKAKAPRQPILAAAALEGMVAVDSDAIAFQKAEGSSLFQNLEVRGYNAEQQVGIIDAAYGETVGHYATWAGVRAQGIRSYNRLPYGSLLRPGQEVIIPLQEVSLNAFSQARFEYHQSREEDFYSTFAVSEALKVKVRRGDTVWDIAQSNNVPMWLFYQHNPGLVGKSLRRGATVLLPVIEELSVLESPEHKAAEATEPAQP